MRELIFFIIGCIFIFYLLDIRKNCYIQNNDNHIFQEKIKTLVRQAARWSTAAKQDENTMVAILHANYGAGYLWALKDIASDSQIVSATGINLDKFIKEIIKIQDMVTMKMSKICPDYSPESTYLTKIGGEGQ
jgi:hypothetical protein